MADGHYFNYLENAISLQQDIVTKVVGDQD